MPLLEFFPAVWQVLSAIKRRFTSVMNEIFAPHMAAHKRPGTVYRLYLYLGVSICTRISIWVCICVAHKTPFDMVDIYVGFRATKDALRILKMKNKQRFYHDQAEVSLIIDYGASATTRGEGPRVNWQSERTCVKTAKSANKFVALLFVKAWVLGFFCLWDLLSGFVTFSQAAVAWLLTNLSHNCLRLFCTKLHKQLPRSRPLGDADTMYFYLGAGSSRRYSYNCNSGFSWLAQLAISIRIFMMTHTCACITK